MGIATPEEVQAYIRQAAAARGIDPTTALRVFKQESSFNVNAQNISKKEESYGVTQLNAMGGLGEVALKKGINIRDPNTWRQQLDFSLDTVAKDGWRQWYGARDVGIGRWDGIGSGPNGQGAKPMGIGATSRMSASLTTPQPGAAPAAVPVPAQGAPVPTMQAAVPAAPVNPNSGAGLIAMMGNDDPMSMSKIKTFLGGAQPGGVSPLSGVTAGLGIMAQGMGGGGSQAPQIQTAPIDANAPDMSFMSLLTPARKRKMQNVAG